MKPIRLLLILVVMLLTPIELSSAQEGQEAMKIYDQIKNVELDESKVAEVESLVLIRDAAVFRLNKGKICLFKPVEGRVTGAVYVGEGVFEFSAPTEIERYQLKRFTEQEVLRDGFDELCLWFSDSTAEELEHNLSFSGGRVPAKSTVVMKGCRRRLPAGEGQKLWCCVLKGILADSRSSSDYPESHVGLFYADIKTGRGDRLFYTFDPGEVEEVVLKVAMPGGGQHERELACSFHQADDYLRNPRATNTPIPNEEKSEIRIVQYNMKVDISPEDELSAKARVDFECLKDGAHVIGFRLSPDLEIDRITNEQGDSLWHIKVKDQYPVYLVLGEATRSGEARTLTFEYSGKLIPAPQRIIGSLYVSSPRFWYPRYGSLERGSYELTFRYPKGYTLVSVGEKAKEWIEGDLLCGRWVTDFPVSVAYFNYGEFDNYDVSVEGLPTVCVYDLEASHRETTEEHRKVEEAFVADLVTRLSFFQNVFGESPLFSYQTFRVENTSEETTFFAQSMRGQSAAQQWWADALELQTYHDEWLGLGVGKYSGVWYAQVSLGDNQAFFGEIEAWRKDIIERGAWEVGLEAGPIWLGYRLSSSQSERYQDLIGTKGAYVLHMLRYLMRNFESRSDSSFIAMMRDFVETYYGKEASTEDFKEIVEKHVGEDMDWFFDQWVYGIDIPTYKFSYSTKPTADGKHLVTCEVDQENVPKDFRMWVPILLDFGMDQHAILRLWVDKPHNEYQLPKAPLKPKDVVLNPAHAVLCEVKNK
jgi:hypothetical protein